VELRVLGPLEVVDDGIPLGLGGARQRLVLAYLILEANRVVSTDRLIDRIWGDEPPDAARAALFAYISRLRKLLGPARIQARPPGYVLLAETDEVDALRFIDLVDAARATAEPTDVATLLTEALALWRGGALADLAEHDALRPAITRLEELRVTALEDRIGADLALGRHRESVPLLESLVADHPLRERLWSQLILALYRSGRQGEALGAFHRARTTLVDELGIDPSPELRRLHEQVLKQDPALDLRAAPPSAAVALPVAEPESVPTVSLPAAPPGRPGRRDGRRRLLVGGTVIVLVVLLAGSWLARQGGVPTVRWTIGLDMPLTGEGARLGKPVRDAVQMAVDDIGSAGGVHGSTLVLTVLDDAQDPQRAAANADVIVADPTAIAMIGPWGSAATFPVIPVTNSAGLLQCSPSSTHPGLTKPRDGALDLRTSHPEAVNFVRLAPADDIQAIALGSFAYRDLAARAALVVDDAGVGRDIADGFEAEFARLGGSTIRRTLNPGFDPRTVLTPLADGTDTPRLVFFGGVPEIGAAVRRAMADAGRAAIPMLSWDFLHDGSGREPGSYIQRVGTETAVGSYVAHASLPDQKFSFADAYRQRFGTEPDEYAAAGYACVEIVAAALGAVAARDPGAGDVRALVRAYAVDPTHRYETVLGTVGFDANGDALEQFVTFYRVDPSGAGGAGDWVILKEQDFGPAP
jgi:ABC-type branched-subunit amino acid transport system substrate-binding protein/DNA-binding SARP family transcriptional activator